MRRAGGMSRPARMLALPSMALRSTMSRVGRPDASCAKVGPAGCPSCLTFAGGLFVAQLLVCNELDQILTGYDTDQTVVVGDDGHRICVVFDHDRSEIERRGVLVDIDNGRRHQLTSGGGEHPPDLM